MLKVKIQKWIAKSQNDWVYEWSCPMCHRVVAPDLDEAWVRAMIRRHLLVLHKVHPEFINIIVKRKK